MVDAKLCCMNSANRLSYPMTKMTFHRPAGSRTSVVTSKPAMRGRLKTGHGEGPETGFVLPRRRWFGKAGFDFSYVLS